VALRGRLELQVAVQQLNACRSLLLSVGVHRFGLDGGRSFVFKVARMALPDGLDQFLLMSVLRWYHLLLY
jgi:hypothetical protein